jgi:hypothetical protein
MAEIRDYGNAPLPRTIKLSEAAWLEGKAKAAKLGITVRQFVEDAVKSEMPNLIRQLRQVGLLPEYWPNKTVRVPLADGVLAAMKDGRKRTGLAENLVLSLCLHHFAGRRRRRQRTGDKT